MSFFWKVFLALMVVVTVLLVSGGSLLFEVVDGLPEESGESKELWDALGRVFWWCLFVGVGASLGVAGIAWRRLAKPYGEVLRAVLEIGRGRVSRPLPAARNDEIGSLARAVNRVNLELRSRSEQVDREAREKAAILKGMTEGLVAVDQDQKVVLINDAACDLLNLDRASQIGKPVWEVCREPDLIQSVEICLASGRAATRELLTEPDGEVRVIRLGAAPFSHSENTVDGCVLVLLDLTELRRLEQVRRDFVANVSHELKTPLTAIRGYVETVLEDEAIDPALRTNFLRKALVNTDRLSAIIRDFLSLARIEAEDGVLRREPVTLAVLARQCVSNASGAAEAKGVALALDMMDHGEFSVEADPEALALALDNLLDNAIKYSPRDGQVALAVQRASGFVRIQVSDQGPGIEESEKERIFERFYRVDRDRSRELGGTGLGLSIVKHVAVSHGGQVSVQSELGAGSRFEISLPL